MVVWLFGMWVLAGWLIVRLGLLRKGIKHCRRGAAEELPQWFSQLLGETARQLKLRRLPKVVLSRKVASPAVFGIFRPILLIPVANIDKLSPQEAQHVLLHELAHIKRGDLAVHGFYMLLQIAYWFNPLLWLVGRHLRHLRELCCDATVARVLRENTHKYRQTLLATARQLLAQPNEPGMGLLGLFEDSSRLIIRLKWLEKKTWRHRRLRIATVCVMIAVMAACVLPMAQAQKEIPVDTLASERPEQPKQDKFIATLANGVTVELVGLGTAPWETEQQWWQPDGTEIDKPQFKARPNEWRQKDPNGLQFKCATLFRFSDHLNKKISVPEGEFSNKFLFRGSGSGIADDGTYIMNIVYHPHEDVPNKADISLALGVGPFKKATTSERLSKKQHQIYLLEGNLVVIRHPIRIDSNIGTLTVDLTCPAKDYDFRVLAELKDGSTEQWYGGSIGKEVKFFHATPKRENIKIEDIEELIIEYRPYQWMTFKNVSLQPGRKTDVAIELGEDLASAEPTKIRSPLSVGPEATIEIPRQDQPVPAVTQVAATMPTVPLPEFTKTLDNGVTVELVGICKHPSEGEQWWRPDGNVLAERPYDRAGGKISGSENYYELAFRIDNLPDPAFGWTIETEGGGSLFSEVVKNGHDVPNLRSMTAGFNNGTNKGDILFGIATGLWKTIESSEGAGAYGSSGSDGAFLFSKPNNTEDGATITVTHDKKSNREDYRIVAVDLNDKVYASSRTNGGSISQLTQTTVYYQNLNLDQIKEFRFQTRPYQWMIFKNVSLQLGRKTDVAIELGEDLASAEPTKIRSPLSVGPEATIEIPRQDQPVPAVTQVAATMPKLTPPGTPAKEDSSLETPFQSSYGQPGRHWKMDLALDELKQLHQRKLELQRNIRYEQPSYEQKQKELQQGYTQDDWDYQYSRQMYFVREHHRDAVDRLFRQVKELTSKRDSLLKTATADNPEVKTIDDEIYSLQEQLNQKKQEAVREAIQQQIEAYEGAVQGYTRELTAVMEQYEQVETRLLNMDAKIIAIQRTQKEIDSLNRRLEEYESLISTHKVNLKSPDLVPVRIASECKMGEDSATGYLFCKMPGTADDSSRRPMPQKDVIAMQQAGYIIILESDSFLQRLLQRTNVMNTKWWQSMKDDPEALMKSLEAGFSIGRDAEYLMFVMFAKDPQEAKIIVDEALKEFVSQIREQATADLYETLYALTDQRDDIERQVKRLERELEKMAMEM
jgi:beta-lactamase regulating signal transducer with metallopeptidase domain